jgi:predicted acyl esterase
MTQAKSETRDGTQVTRDRPVEMDDGLVLRADIFRPVAEGSYPAILSDGPYGKGLAFQEGYKTAREVMARENPDAVAATEHCRHDNPTLGQESMIDWLADRFGIDQRRLKFRPG